MVWSHFLVITIATKAARAGTGKLSMRATHDFRMPSFERTPSQGKVVSTFVILSFREPLLHSASRSN